MKRVLITGGCGFVGSSLALDLAGQGYLVSVFDNLSRRGSEIILKRLQLCGIEFIHGDIRNLEDFDKIQGEYDLLLECSAEPSFLAGLNPKDARYLLNVNLAGAINCFEWARENKVPVIFFSTARVYPYSQINSCEFEETATRFELVKGSDEIFSEGIRENMPLAGVRSLYGVTKLSAEMILQEYAAYYGLPSIINRCGVIAGPWQMGKVDQGVLTYWLINHYFKQPLFYKGFGGKGKQVRDILHIEDLVQLVRQQVKNLLEDSQKYRGDIYNVSGGKDSSLSLLEATKFCAKVTGYQMDIGSSPETPLADVIWSVLDAQKAVQEFCWEVKKRPEDIFEDIFQWVKKNEKQLESVFLTKG